MIRKAEMNDLDALTTLVLALWPENTAEELKKELADLLKQEDAACFLAFGDGAAIGFAQCQLRRDYVEGTGSSPVGYLEGIYVAEPWRRQGTAKKILAACEAWAVSRGCREFASDCELENTQSLAFHLALGFAEANRVICFTKQLTK